MKTGFIICGALGREVLDIIRRHGWDAEVLGVPALDHNYPDRIAPDVERRIYAYREKYERLIVVFGDCGSRGALDALLARFPDIDRIAGPHCYEMYGGPMFHDLMEEELGTFFLTDFLLRGFEGLFIKEMGLDRFPQLRDDYFAHYKRVVYLAQNPTPELLAKAQEVADYLKLALEVRVTGYGLLEERLVEIVGRGDKRQRSEA
jgi:hypothetical protein